jgi:hypothetical protein
MRFTCGGAIILLSATVWTQAAAAQSPGSGFEGMWSDPPRTIAGTFCAAWCTDEGINFLNALLDDPANDARPFTELQAKATSYQRDKYIAARLTPDTLKYYPLDPADDPGFLRCEPWGLARQIFARHQLEIRRRGDRLEMRYGEWDARRTIDLKPRAGASTQTPSVMGHSAGRWDGDALVIETSGITPNLTSWDTKHSDRLKVIERYTRSKDGKRLTLTATMEDPATWREPLVIKKMWEWAPGRQISPYVDCERPREFSKGTNRP